MNKEKILNQFNSGMSLTEIAKGVYLTEAQVKTLLQAWGIILPKLVTRRIVMPDRTILLDIYNEQGNLGRTAEHLGVSVATVSKWVRKLNIPIKKMHFNSPKEELKFLEKHLELVNC